MEGYLLPLETCRGNAMGRAKALLKKLFGAPPPNTQTKAQLRAQRSVPPRECDCGVEDRCLCIVKEAR